MTKKEYIKSLPEDCEEICGDCGELEIECICHDPNRCENCDERAWCDGGSDGCDLYNLEGL